MLRGVSVTIKAGEHVGVVGRTGAGKSSLIAALFRMAPTTGMIFFDDVPTCSIPLKTLREAISVIPQVLWFVLSGGP